MTSSWQRERMLESHDLTVRYGSFTAADGVSLAGEAGEILGLLGPNGAGKTSVIRALTTLVPVSRGRARIAGHELSDPVAVRSSIGVLPESNGYPAGQTARSYLRFYGELFGLSRAAAASRADRHLRRMGLADNHRRIGTFSRGMRQRLGLARAMINDPAVLFLDEPTLGLDPVGQQELLAELARAAVEDGVCVVLCSHLLDEVERVCDRVAILNGGRIVAEGSVDDVIAASGVAGFCRLRVAAHDVPAAHSILRTSPAARTLRLDNSTPGEVAVELAAGDGVRAELLRTLLDAGIEPQSFDVRGARLSDAFGSLTGPSEEAIR